MHPIVYLNNRCGYLGGHSVHSVGYSLSYVGFKIIVLNGASQSGTNIYTYTYSPAFSATPFTALGLINM